MRLLLILALAATAHAEPARITIENSALWPSHDKPVSVRFAGGAWHRVRTGKARTIEVPVTTKAIAIDVQAPSGAKSFRRWAMVKPDTAYRLIGNPCAMYGLEVDAKNENPSTIRVDASALPAAWFPIVVSTDLMVMDDEEPSGPTLDAPGVSAAIELEVSAMCARSGSSVIVYSKPLKRAIFDETLIAHPAVEHTLTLTKRGFTITLARFAAGGRGR